MCFLFLLVFHFSMKNRANFFSFFTFFFELFTLFGKTCFMFFGLFLFNFSFICFFMLLFFCLIFLDLLRNMFPFKNVFFTFLFPLFVHPLSICSFFFVSSCFLVSFTFFTLLKLPFLSFYYLHVSLCQTLCGKIIFLNFCKTLFCCLPFPSKKTSFSLFPFLLGLFLL